MGNAGTAAITDGSAHAVGAGLGVLLGATAGNAFATDRTEADDDALWAANLLMVPLAWLGGVVAAMIEDR